MSDMFPPEAYCFVAAILALSRTKDNTGAGFPTFQQRRPCESRDPCGPSVRDGINCLRDNYRRWLWVPAFAGTTTSPPCSPVFFVLRLDRIARSGPVGVGPFAQLIKVSARGQRLAAVHRDGLAVDPVAAAGNKEHCEVLQLLHFTNAAH